jgi:hypothetical protein
MTYTGRTRDGYRRALTAVTTLTTVGALTACGWLAGTAAHDHNAQQQAQDAARQQTQRQALAKWQRQRAAWRATHGGARVRTVWKKHPQTTVVDTRVVRSAGIGTGGTLSSSSGSSSSGSSSSGSGSGGGGGGRPPASHAAPPPPPPKPAPSSGS